jgi:hypothetical protein
MVKIKFLIKNNSQIFNNIRTIHTWSTKFACKRNHSPLAFLVKAVTLVSLILINLHVGFFASATHTIIIIIIIIYLHLNSHFMLSWLSDRLSAFQERLCPWGLYFRTLLGTNTAFSLSVFFSLPFIIFVSCTGWSQMMWATRNLLRNSSHRKITCLPLRMHAKTCLLAVYNDVRLILLWLLLSYQ